MKSTTATNRPLRESVSAPKAGDVIDGTIIGIPRWERVTHLSASLPWLVAARKHLVVDGMPAREAARRTGQLAKLITNLARVAGKRGWYVSVHAPSHVSGQGQTWGLGGVSAVVWLTDPATHRIMASGKVHWDGSIVEGNVYHYGSNRADRLLARILERSPESSGFAR